jgi:hypothetical protein
MYVVTLSYLKKRCVENIRLYDSQTILTRETLNVKEFKRVSGNLKNLERLNIK